MIPTQAMEHGGNRPKPVLRQIAPFSSTDHVLGVSLPRAKADNRNHKPKRGQFEATVDMLEIVMWIGIIALVLMALWGRPIVERLIW